MARSCAGVVLQMLRAGMPPLDAQDLQVNTGRVVRYGPKKRAWYRVHEMTGRTGRPFFVGAFGCWGLIETQRIEPDQADVDGEDRARMRLEVQAAREREEHRRARRALRARLSARETWARAVPIERATGYLRRKGVKPCPGLRAEDDDVLIVPMIRYDRSREDALVGVQRIWPDGTKRFTTGSAKTGSCVRLGDPPQGRAPVLLLCEGLATGLSIREALDGCFPIFAGFDAGNLVDVAAVLRELWPEVPMGIFADDDFQTAGNPGRRYALHAARKVKRAAILTPQFSVHATRGKWTDFNDLHAIEGLGAVRLQLQPFIEFLEERL